MQEIWFILYIEYTSKIGHQLRTRIPCVGWKWIRIRKGVIRIRISKSVGSLSRFDHKSKMQNSFKLNYSFNIY